METGGAVDAQVEELWKLQLCLNTYVGETETELDSSIVDLFPDTRPPDWFNSGIVFSPLIMAFDKEIKELEDRVYDMQQEALELLKAKKPETPDPDQAQEQLIIDSHKEVDQLKQEVDELEAAVNPPLSFAEKKELFFEEEVKRATEVHDELAEENRKLEEVIGEWLVEVEKATNEYIAACTDLKKNSEIAKQYRRKIKEMRMAKDKCSKSKDYYADKLEGLERVVDQLLDIKQRNAEAVVRLQETCGKHQELLASINNAQILIRESGARQEDSLAKMIDAMELAEKTASQVHRHHVKCEVYREEVERIQGVMETTKIKFDELVEDYQQVARRYFEPYIQEMYTRIEQLKQDRCQLLKQKESLERQMEATNQNNASIQAIESQTSSLPTSPADLILKCKSEFQAKFAEKERLVRLISETRQSMASIEAGLLDIGPSKRQEAVYLRQHRQELEMQLSVVQTKLGDINTKNALLAEENRRRQSLIDSVKLDAQRLTAQKMKEYDATIAKMQHSMENIQRENALQIQDLEECITRSRANAEEHHNEACHSSNQFEEARKQKQLDIAEAKRLCRSLKSTIEGNQAEMEKGKLLLQQANDQVALLRSKTIRLQKEEQRQRRIIEKLTSDQVALTTENDHFQSVHNDIVERIAAKQRQITQLGQSKSTGDLVELEFGVDII